MSDNLRITNMVLSGKAPFKRRLSDKDMEGVVTNGRLHWEVHCENTSPILMARIKKDGLTLYGKAKHACVSFWVGGAVNIVGVTSRKEAECYYAAALQDIRRLTRGVVKRK